MTPEESQQLSKILTTVTEMNDNLFDAEHGRIVMLERRSAATRIFMWVWVALCALPTGLRKMGWI